MLDTPQGCACGGYVWLGHGTLPLCRPRVAKGWHSHLAYPLALASKQPHCTDEDTEAQSSKEGLWSHREEAGALRFKPRSVSPSQAHALSYLPRPQDARPGHSSVEKQTREPTRSAGHSWGSPGTESRYVLFSV